MPSASRRHGLHIETQYCISSWLGRKKDRMYSYLSIQLLYLITEYLLGYAEDSDGVGLIVVSRCVARFLADKCTKIFSHFQILSQHEWASLVSGTATHFPDVCYWDAGPRCSGTDCLPSP